MVLSEQGGSLLLSGSLQSPGSHILEGSLTNFGSLCSFGALYVPWLTRASWDYRDTLVRSICLVRSALHDSLAWLGALVSGWLAHTKWSPHAA